MQTRKLTVDEISYNPERGAFEAQVQIRQDDDLFSHPAHVCAPLHADYAHVMRGLLADAEATHLGKQSGLRLRLSAGISAPSARSGTLAQVQRMLRNLDNLDAGRV